MNPLCCIAPVSIDRENGDPGGVVGGGIREQPPNGEGRHRGGRNSNASSGGKQQVVVGRRSEVVAPEIDVGDLSSTVAGLMYKWVNYGKGWRGRWFVLEDGVLSYYKFHGQDRVLFGAEGFKGVRVIGEESARLMREASFGKFGSGYWEGKPFGEIHLKVSSIRASNSDDKKLSIFSGTKTLHLRCESSEDRTSWFAVLLTAKDALPRAITSSDSLTSKEITISTDKLRCRLLKEGVNVAVIRDCESIMLSELLDLQDRLTSLEQKYFVLVDKLRQLEADKVELETTVVSESKDRDIGIVNGRCSDFYSIMSDGTASDSEADNGSQSDDDGVFVDTKEFWSSESLRSSSQRSGEYDIRTDDRDPCSSTTYFTRIKSLKYPYVRRRTRLPEPKEKEKPVGLWSIIKENIGKDLTGVCLPVYFNEPLSSLQKCCEDLEYSYLVDRASEWGKKGNSLMRILHIAAFAVSGYASTEGRQCKPFNPLLGETFEADYPDKGFRFFSEKVSHHPMVIACHCDGNGWKFWGDSNLKGKFWGRSIQLDPVGVLTLQFDDGETFQWSKVTTSIYNIIIGKIYCDHYGTMRIKGDGNYSCKLRFKEQSIIDRNPHQVQGFVQDNKTGKKVAMLMGKWDEAMYYVLGDPSTKTKGYDPRSEAVLLWERDKSMMQTRYNFTPFAISLNELTPGMREKLPPTDSRLRPDQRFLENGEFEMANSEKLRLEQAQRQARKLQEGGWQPRWFTKDKETDCYTYTGGYWDTKDRGAFDGIPHIFGQAIIQTDGPTVAQ